MSLTTSETVNVDIVLDVACGASYLGYTRLRRAAARRRAEGDAVGMAFRPFQVAPEAPATVEPLLTALRRKFGGSPELETARFAAFAAEEGLQFNYDRAVHGNTFEAHRLIAVASAQGAGEEMVERLFRAHYTDGLDVADLATLRRLADEVGVVWSDAGAEEVRTELERVRRAGVTRIPVFSFGSGRSFSGVQPESVLYKALEGSAGSAWQGT